MIDIIRPKADKQYLDDIARHMNNSNDSGEQAENCTSEDNQDGPDEDGITIVYCDRNNTSDIWGDLKSNFDLCGSQTESMLSHGVKDYRTIVLLPKMEQWQRSQYIQRNPICPHLIYECCKRIFGRKDHTCLSAANKPKAVEVVLKFAKLHDGFDFEDHQQILAYFDEFRTLDFMRYDLRPRPLEESTIEAMIHGYNRTPDNFGVPTDEVIDHVIHHIDRQMDIDAKMTTLGAVRGEMPFKELSMNQPMASASSSAASAS